MANNNFGSMLKKIRKQNGWTQDELAQQLHVSDKTVSKWENGRGYPDWETLPVISKTLGVSIDYLLKGNPKGITIAGSIVVDILNTVDVYPDRSMLANVLHTEKAVGGCVPNTLIDLAKMDPSLFLSAIGKIGDDENGRFMLSQLGRYGIDTKNVIVSRDYATSFTNVMQDLEHGERTFFYTKGANQDLQISDFAVDELDCGYFHIGYAVLLDLLDCPDEEYGTKMARLLHMVNQRGIKTSIDAISSDTPNYGAIIIPSLKYCSYVFMNEIESSLVSKIPPRNQDGSINPDNIKATLAKLMEYGVQEKAIIHCKEAGFLMNAKGEFVMVPSLRLPSDYIQGNVGAGDAFAAGCLYGLYNGYSDREILEFASCAAAANLSAADSVSGMKSVKEVQKLGQQYPRLPIV